MFNYVIEDLAFTNNHLAQWNLPEKVKVNVDFSNLEKEIEIEEHFLKYLFNGSKDDSHDLDS